MIRNYNLLSGSRDTRLKNRNVTDVGIPPTSAASKRSKLSFGFIGMFITFLMISFSSSAQVSVLLNPSGYGYTFSSSSGTYTALTGGTVFQSGATLNTDAVSAAITLPSVFTFNGIKQNTIFISNNGFITFAKAQTTVGNVLPLSTTTTSGYDGAIAGLANNLVASSVAGAVPEISYGLAGGDFVVQFQDLGVSTFTSTRINFQIILKADGKTVQIVYGPNNVGQASVGGSQVGLRGTCDEDWNNRSLASGGNWNTSGGAAGTANTSTMTWTAASTLPASGLTFQWSPTAYAPTYLATPFSTIQDFTTWTNGSGPNNVPSTNWATNGYGNASWQIDSTPATTTTSGWTSTGGAYTPVDYAAASGGHSARFQSFISNSPQVGYLDYYVDLSGGLGALSLTFNTINTSGTDILQVFLSTDGGATFTQVGSNIGVNATWTAQTINLGSITSATSIIRFKATSDFGGSCIGLDNVAINQPPVTPPNCSTALVPADLATGVGRNTILTWAAASGSPLSYDVYFGTTTNPPLVTNTTGLSYSPGIMAATTQYFWKVVPKNDNGDAVGCVEQSFTTSAGFTYCLPTYGSGCSGDNIAAVSLGSLSDTGLTCSPVYEDRSLVQNAVPVLGQGATENITITCGTDGNQFNAVWIDFDQNGTFDASEFFSLGTNAGASTAQVIPIAVPLGAVLGTTKMRIRGGGDSQTTAAQACGAATSGFGAARDYNVTIGPPPTCLAPNTLSATGLTTTGATLNWVCATCTGTFRVEYNVSPATFGGVGNIVIDPATSGTAITGLTQNTNYTFFVRQDCGVVDGVSTIASASFTTPAAGESCIDAAVIPVAPDLASSTFTSVITGATADGPAGTCSNATGNPNKKDRWISFVAPTNGNKIVITTTGGTLTDWVMQVWSSCPATGTALGCSDDVNGLMPQLEFCQNQYVGGQTYYIQLFPFSATATGTCNVKVYEDVACLIPPDNDECAGVITIPVGLAGSCTDNAITGTTTNATATPGIIKNACDPFGTYLDVFYKFNSGTSTDISFNFTNITGTNEFGIYSDCGLTYLGVCSSGTYSNLITGLTPNTDYYIVVWANTPAAQGDFSICINSLAPPVCVASPIAPANGAVDINTCAATTLSWTGVPDAIAYDVYFDAGTSATTLVSPDQAAFTGTNTYNAGILLPSTTYAWRVIPKNSAGSPTGCIDFTFTTGAGIATPGNTFATANDLGLLGTTLSASGDTTCYTNDYDSTTTPGNALGRTSNDVFYKFTLGCNTTVTLGTCTNNFDTYMHLLDSTGAWIDSDDDTCPANAGSLIENIALTAGTYYVVVEGFSGTGTFTLDLANTGASCSSVVNLKMFIEGYYIGAGAMTTVADNQAGNPPTSTDVETITVELHDATAPYALAATTTAMLKTDGTVTASFSTAPSGSYYIAVLTRNAIQTWSATPQTVGSTPITYNFSDAITKAYADNMIEIEAGIFAFFSGDITDGVSQDGLIDGADYSKWEADNNDFAFGVFATDLNGDGLVDGADYSIWESNNNNFIFANIPQ